MALDNFLPVNRELQKHWIYKDSSYLHCWLEMLFNARWSEEPKTDIYKGVLYTINRGEFLYSRPTYSDRLKVSEGKLKTLMKLLINEKMIEPVNSLGNNKPTVYRILKYEIYNGRPSECVDFVDVGGIVRQVTTKSKPSDDQVTTNRRPLKNIDNIDNKEKEEKKPKELKTFLPDSVEVRASEYLWGKIFSNNPDAKKPNIQLWAKEFDLMMRVDNRSQSDIGKVIDFCQSDQFWKSNILSAKKLREKYDQLKSKMNNTHSIPIKGSMDELTQIVNSDHVQKFLRGEK